MDMPTLLDTKLRIIYDLCRASTFRVPSICLLTNDIYDSYAKRQHTKV